MAVAAPDARRRRRRDSQHEPEQDVLRSDHLVSAAATVAPQPLRRPRPSARGAHGHAEDASRDRTPAAALEPHSPLACQVAATQRWRSDLKTLWSRAAERFPDVCWTTEASSSETPDDGGTETEDDSALGHGARSFRSVRSLPPARDGLIWAHKAILYSRAPNTFQTRYLALPTPSARLNELGSTSQISLPLARAPSPDPSLLSKASSRKRVSVRGSAPPSSFTMSRRTSAGGYPRSLGFASDTEGEEDDNGALARRNAAQPSIESDAVSLGEVSLASVASTVKPPMLLRGVGRSFFEATLEYLYTAEETLVDTFEFLFEDRIGAGAAAEERLDKLRQDFVFMWRSHLYSDVQIVLGDDDEAREGGRGGPVRTIPDASASVYSMSLDTVSSSAGEERDGGTAAGAGATSGPTAAADHHEDEQQVAIFSSHRFLLASRSPYFAAQLLSPYADSNARQIRLPSPPFTPAATHFTLGFLYTGTLFFSNRTFDLATAFQLWRCGAYLGVETLQELVSALIAHDFCHRFACSPPCRTCLKRVPRVLAFTASPDVADDHLRAEAQAAVSGEHFGSYWARDVGQLDRATRTSLVDVVCRRVDGNGGAAISALRQLAVIGRRIDVERSTDWVLAVRAMCEAVEAHVRSRLENHLDAIVASEEWLRLVEGTTFDLDVLERALFMLVEGLSERRAAHVYEVLVGKVLLRDEAPATGQVASLVEETRDRILTFLRRRWVGVRALGGFGGLENWALKELSHELDVPAADLLPPDPVASSASVAAAPTSRTGLRAAVPRTPAKANAPVDPSGEREAGPIDLRAAVLNRNAVKVSAAHGYRTGLEAGGVAARADRQLPAASTTAAGTASMGTSRTAVPATRRTVSRTDVAAATRDIAVRSAHTSAGVRPSAGDDDAGTSATPYRHRSSPSRASSIASSTRSDGSTTPSVVRSTASSGRRNPASAVASTSTTKIPRRTPSLASSSARPDGSISGMGSVAAGSARSRVGSTASQSSTASRLAQRTSNVVPRCAEPAGANSSKQPSRGAAPKAAATSDRGPRHARAPLKSQSSQLIGSVRRGAPDADTASSAVATKAPPAPGATPAADSSSMPTSMDREGEARDSLLDSCALGGTRLSLGIPCIVGPQPTSRGAKSARFRATVRYIGPVRGREGTWLGVEVPLPLPAGLDEADVGDGRCDGVRYFELGEQAVVAIATREARPEREARRRRIAAMTGVVEEELQSPQPEPMALDGISGSTARRPPSAKSGPVLSSSARAANVVPTSALSEDHLARITKRRKEEGKPQPGATRSLFIRPASVLWVCV